MSYWFTWLLLYVRNKLNFYPMVAIYVYNVEGDKQLWHGFCEPCKWVQCSNVLCINVTLRIKCVSESASDFMYIRKCWNLWKDWPILMGGKHLCFPVKFLSSTLLYSSYKISPLEERIVNLYSYTQLITFCRCNSSYLVLTLQTNMRVIEKPVSSTLRTHLLSFVFIQDCFKNIKESMDSFFVESRILYTGRSCSFSNRYVRMAF